jgi:hypothetical protein
MYQRTKEDELDLLVGHELNSSRGYGYILVSNSDKIPGLISDLEKAANKGHHKPIRKVTLPLDKSFIITSFADYLKSLNLTDNEVVIVDNFEEYIDSRRFDNPDDDKRRPQSVWENINLQREYCHQLERTIGIVLCKKSAKYLFNEPFNDFFEWKAFFFDGIKYGY